MSYNFKENMFSSNFYCLKTVCFCYALFNNTSNILIKDIFIYAYIIPNQSHSKRETVICPTLKIDFWVTFKGNGILFLAT